MRKTKDDQFPAWKVSWMLKKESLKKDSLINQEPFQQIVLSVIDCINLLVEEVHDKFSQILVRMLLISV